MNPDYLYEVQGGNTEFKKTLGSRKTLSITFIYMVGFCSPENLRKFSVFYFFLLDDEFQFLLRSLSALMFINVIILVPSATILKCR